MHRVDDEVGQPGSAQASATQPATMQVSKATRPGRSASGSLRRPAGSVWTVAKRAWVGLGVVVAGQALELAEVRGRGWWPSPRGSLRGLSEESSHLKATRSEEATRPTWTLQAAGGGYDDLE